MSFFIIALTIVILDIITVWGVKRSFPVFSARHTRGIKRSYIIQIILSLIIILGGYFLKDHTRNYKLFAVYYYLFGLVLAVYLPKVLFVLFTGVDYLASLIYKRRRKRLQLYPREPRHIIARCGIFIGLLGTFLIAWGILIGRYDYEIEEVTIEFEQLPQAFDGFSIAQISDVHAGSFYGSTGRFKKVVEMINGQHPDIIAFTGDMVNNFAEESEPLIPIFSKLDAQAGKYAILGNHDYGVYYKWEKPEDEETNLNKLKHNISLMGFELLNNDAVVISKDSASIALIGVENWGILPRHPKKGDIEKASRFVQNVPFKILLSHDPSYWDESIVGKTDIALTLSGHTHGLQMGVRIGGRRYSPARFQYNHWAGLYHTGNQYLYVNRGLGVIGFPGRLGMAPEITIIRLKSTD